MSAGLPPRLFLQGSLSLLCHHQSLADGSQELSKGERSKEAPGPLSAPNPPPLGRSQAAGKKVAVGWVGPGLFVPLVATGLSGPQWPLHHVDVPKDPGRKCFLRTQDEEKDMRPET